MEDEATLLTSQGDALAIPYSEVMRKMRNFTKLDAMAKKSFQLVARSVDAQHCEHMRTAFTRLDANGDGMLTVSEMQIACEKAGIDDGEIYALFADADNDKSGSIDYTEFLTIMMCSSLLSCKKACYDAFRVIDTDGTYRLEKHEIVDLLGQSSDGRNIEVESQHIMQMADKDGDGSIDFEEFYSLLQHFLL